MIETLLKYWPIIVAVALPALAVYLKRFFVPKEEFLVLQSKVVEQQELINDIQKENCRFITEERFKEKLNDVLKPICDQLIDIKKTLDFLVRDQLESKKKA
jgi:hypothetical protein